MAILRRSSARWELILVISVLMFGAILRFYNIQSRPGFEWDEPVYASIAEHVTDYGYPAFQPEADQPLVPYLYHPPFDFYLKGWWFKVTQSSGVGAARVLSGIESMMLLGLTYLLVRSTVGKTAALWGLLFMAMDGWLIYTNRLNLIENAMMPIGVAGLCLYVLACNKERTIYFVLAGATLAFAGVYKHTGICFLLVPLINVILTNKQRRAHAVLFGTALAVIILFVVGMYLTWGNEYITQSLIQIRRTFGGISSRGLNFGFGEALQALLNTYWIFFLTLVCIIATPIVIVLQLIPAIRYRRTPEHSILLSWAIAALLFLAAIALKAPQYLIIALVPLYAFGAAKLGPYLERRARLLPVAAVVLVVALNLTTWTLRFADRTDNALLATSQYVAQYLPADALLVTEESIHASMIQPYYKLDSLTYKDLSGIRPTYIILYVSTTLKPPKSTLLDEWMSQSILITHFDGFKEKILIYRIPSKDVLIW